MAAAPPYSLVVDTYHFQHIATSDSDILINPYKTNELGLGNYHMVSGHSKADTTDEKKQSDPSSPIDNLPIDLPFVKITPTLAPSNERHTVTWKQTFGETFQHLFSTVVPKILEHNSLKSSNTRSRYGPIGVADGFTMYPGELSCHLKDALYQVYPIQQFESTLYFGVNVMIQHTDRLICVGDIHGGLFGLVQILYRMRDHGILDLNTGIVKDGYTVVFLGDVVDRGNASVVCWLLLSLLVLCQKQNGNHKFILLRGNHEGGMFSIKGGVLSQWKQTIPTSDSDPSHPVGVGLLYQLQNRVSLEQPVSVEQMEEVWLNELYDFYQMTLCFPTCARIQFRKDSTTVKSVMLQHGCAPDLNKEFEAINSMANQLYQATPFPMSNQQGYDTVWSDVYAFIPSLTRTAKRPCVRYHDVANLLNSNQVDLLVRGHTDSEYTAYVNVNPDLLLSLPIYLLYDKHHRNGRNVDQLPLGFLYYDDEMTFNTLPHDTLFVSIVNDSKERKQDAMDYMKYRENLLRTHKFYKDISWSEMKQCKYGVVHQNRHMNYYDTIWNEWSATGKRVLFPVIDNVLWRATHNKSQGLVSRLMPDTQKAKKVGIQPVVTTSSNTGYSRDLSGTAFLCIHVVDTTENVQLHDQTFDTLRQTIQTHRKKLRDQSKYILTQYPTNLPS